MSKDSEMTEAIRRMAGEENADEQLNLIFGLREVRMVRGMSVSEVAEAMGVDPSQVSRFETGGTNPTMVTIRRYAKAVRAVFRIQVRSFEQDQAEHYRRAQITLITNSDEDRDQPLSTTIRRADFRYSVASAQ